MTDAKTPPDKSDKSPGLDFVRQIVAEDNRTGKWGGKVVTRFPPEPNGYLHVGHAKAIALDFGLAMENGGSCHLRFDDTNPETEDMKYVESIKNDVRWLGFDWKDDLYFASDYFDRLYECAEELVRRGKAYVDSSTDEEIKELRGTVKQAGRPSAHRDRTVEENLDMFRRMKAGEFKDGEHVLRAKADLASSNMKMRDPLMYRIRHASHYRTGDTWCIYPMYDFTHCLSDSFEGITHSLCTLEFENNRELYDWFLDELEVDHHPQQTEFARLALTYTMMSKRKLLQLVEEGRVSGWDDPRMPTIAGLRRRGYTPESIRDLCERVGVAKANSTVDVGQLEFSIRNDLNTKSPRVMAVLRPLKVVITNFPEGKVEWIDAPYLPDDPDKMGHRKVPFTRELYIEQSDFLEEPPRKFFRLGPGREVRFRWAYFLTCEEFIKNDAGEVVELRCTYDPETRGGNAPDGRKVKGTIHWVSAEHALDAEVRLYDRLFSVEKPGTNKEGDWRDELNSESLEVISAAKVEPSLVTAEPGHRVQFERTGYFCVDSADSTPEKLVFNRTVPLRDSWAKIARKA